MTETTVPAVRTSRFAPKGWIVWPLLALAVACLLASIFLPMKRRAETPDAPLDPSAPPAYFQSPVFALKERSGIDVYSTDLEGKVWVAGFVFTRCKMGCGEVTATMAKLQSDLGLADADDLRLVTFTVDPERDTLADLKAYAEKTKSHPTKWLYLTGPEKLVRPLLKQGFHVTADRKQGGQEGDEFDHTTKLFVVDKKGAVRGSFDGRQGDSDLDGTHYAKSQERLRALVAELRKE